MKIKFFKKEQSFKKEKTELGLNFYWGVAVVLMLTATFASFTFGYYLFSHINKEYVSPFGDTSQVKIIKKERIDKILEYFSAREKKSNEIKNSPSPITDPSL